MKTLAGYAVAVTAKGIRTLRGAGRMKLHKRYTLEIIES